MKNIISIIQEGVVKAVKDIYGGDISPQTVNLTQTRREFEGDFTVVVFPFTKIARKKPDEIGQEMGAFLKENLEEVADFNVIKGFLNLSLSDTFWQSFLQEVVTNSDYGRLPSTGKKVMVEFSSPNTNKPLHLGHIRNILLGWSCSKILEAAGNEVIKVQIINDRGIAICKSMLAWKKFADKATPESAEVKGDHFVGKWYVTFENRFKEEYTAWQASEEGQEVFAKHGKEGQPEAAFFKKFKNQYFNDYSKLGAEAKEMLLQWESGDPETIALWKQMNNWVYQGFDETYEKLGVHFDKLYYESDTYLLGKDLIEEGLSDQLFFKKEDGSVWIDLEDAGLDHKLVLRSDGTAVYMTQDIGTARLRHNDFAMDAMVYVVANEQNYHFQVLFEIMKRLGDPYAEGMHHLSYGMVDLPEGKMKSREGTVVDADDLIAEVIEEARTNASDRVETEGLSKEEREELLRKIGLAALKFFIIKVQPKKGMTFDPKESVDMQGQTGPYIQYSYVRINGIGQRAEREGVDLSLADQYSDFQPLERELLKHLYQLPEVVGQAAAEYDPSTIANYCYQLAKTYSRFWHDVPVFGAEQAEAKAFRLQLSKAVGQAIRFGMDLLGIEMPEKM
jgi:arginyl-tRNA synthetase